MTQLPERRLRLLSAGAAKGIVESLAGAFESRAGIAIDATFDAAGAIRDAFLRAPCCDVVILPAARLAALAAQGFVERGSIRSLGGVPTGIAIASGDRSPAVANADELRASLAAASALYCPDMVRSTAGGHFAGLLRALGLFETSHGKLRGYPNGARAMAALAALGPRGAIGCTQVTEILYTPGVTLVAPLPAPFALTTVYAIAVSQNADNPLPAQAFAAHLAAPETESLRRMSGFSEIS